MAEEEIRFFIDGYGSLENEVSIKCMGKPCPVFESEVVRIQWKQKEESFGALIRVLEVNLDQNRFLGALKQFQEGTKEFPLKGKPITIQSGSAGPVIDKSPYPPPKPKVEEAPMFVDNTSDKPSKEKAKSWLTKIDPEMGWHFGIGLTIDDLTKSFSGELLFRLPPFSFPLYFETGFTGTMRFKPDDVLVDSKTPDVMFLPHLVFYLRYDLEFRQEFRIGFFAGLKMWYLHDYLIDGSFKIETDFGWETDFGALIGIWDTDFYVVLRASRRFVTIGIAGNF